MKRPQSYNGILPLPSDANGPIGASSQVWPIHGPSHSDELADLRLWLDSEIRQRLLALDLKLKGLANQLNNVADLVEGNLIHHGHQWENDAEIAAGAQSPPYLPADSLDLDACSRIPSEHNGLPPLKLPSSMEDACNDIVRYGSSNSDLEAFVKDGDAAEVEKALRAQADPNLPLRAFKLPEMSFKEFSAGTPLAVAVLRRKEDMVKTLLDFGADPDSTYSFLAGASQVECTFPASHATVASGAIAILRILVEAGADLSAVCVPTKANLVWQAAYFGQVEIIRYLLDKKVLNDAPAVSQDNGSDQHTPLQAAARQGHSKVVSMLLDNSADVCGKNGYSRPTPLEDAVVHGHGEIVKILIAKGAQLFQSTPFSRQYLDKGGNVCIDSSRSHPDLVIFSLSPMPDRVGSDASNGGQTPLSVLFNRGNSVVIAKAAVGLRHAPQTELDKLDASALIAFLQTPGKAPVEILRSIVRKHSIRYWDLDSKGRKKRRDLKSALLNANMGFNVCEGPHWSSLNQLYCEQKPIKSEPHCLGPFLAALAPQQNTSDVSSVASRRSLGARRSICSDAAAYVDVDLLMVHVVGLSENMAVLWALAAQRDPEVFAETGCQAIVHLHWNKVSRSVYCLLVYEITYLMLFCSLIVIMRESPDNNDLKDAVPYMAGLCLVANAWEVLLFIAHALGCNLCGLWMRPCNIWTVVELIKYGATTTLLAFSLISDWDAMEETGFKTTLGCLVFFRWMTALEAFRALQSIGLKILPIMSTMREVGPFAGVLLMYLCGCVSAYYALGLHSAFDSFTLFFQIVVMGEVEMDELEGIDIKLQRQQSGDLQMTDAPRTSYYLPVRLLLIATSFFIGLALTNVFIAVLCISYEKASQQAASGFTRALANIVIDHHTRMVGLKSILCRGAKVPGVPSGHSVPGDHPLIEGDTSLGSDYIWYSVPQKDCEAAR